ncbi:MAG: hypothetical protein WCG95_07885 [bacterium]
MSEHCNEHAHEHQHGGDCSCGCGCGCGQNIHGHHHYEEEGGCNCAEKFLQLADEAWKAVLKEKIKAKILEKNGDHVEKLAEIVAMANGEKWKHIISAKTKGHKFKDELKDFFTSHD